MVQPKNIFILCGLVLCLSCGLLGQTNVVYLIPQDYIGGVIILYNQPDGIEPEQTADGTIIYRIPKDGFLKIKQPFIRKAFKFKYYFVDEKDNRTEIEYLYPRYYVRDPGDTTSKSFSTITKDEENNKVFAIIHTTTNFNTQEGRVYLHTFIVAKPKDSSKILTETENRVTK